VADLGRASAPRVYPPRTGVDTTKDGNYVV
jgi:hypothetical protein